MSFCNTSAAAKNSIGSYIVISTYCKIGLWQLTLTLMLI